MEPSRKQLAKVIQFDGPYVTDAMLVADLRRGRHEAADELYRRYAGRIGRLAWRMLGADPDLEDVVQQVFLHALAGVRRLRNPEALEAWLIGITVRTVRREIRSRRLRRRLPELDGQADARDRHPDRGLLVRRLYQTLALLKPDHQIVLTLRYVEGYTLVEVAGACDCSLATVKRRLARARAAFFKRANQDSVLASWIEEERGED